MMQKGEYKMSATYSKVACQMQKKKLKDDYLSDDTLIANSTWGKLKEEAMDGSNE